jgi:hypothetical protein
MKPTIGIASYSVRTGNGPYDHGDCPSITAKICDWRKGFGDHFAQQQFATADVGQSTRS